MGSFEPDDAGPAGIPPDLAAALATGGEMGRRIAETDWSLTSLGPMAEWAQSTRTMVATALSSRFPVVLWFGPDLVLVYNDGYAPMLGAKHPRALGSSGREVWSEIWDTIGPMLQGVLDRGQATWSDDLFLPLERKGFAEECYFTFTYSPIRDEAGAVGGVFCAVHETTERVIGERRLRVLRDLGMELAAALTTESVLGAAERVAAADPNDLPFLLLYRADVDGEATRVAARSGPHDPTLLDRSRAGSSVAGLDDWPLDASRVEPVEVRSPRHALIRPLVEADAHVWGWMVAGISKHVVLDEKYHAFLDLLAEQITSGLARVRAYEAQRERAERLAQLDRAKTAFFTNVSHEFRTPLTLLLAPIDDALSGNGGDALPAAQREGLELAQRNGRRLLRLVNALLDFSRLDGGRLRVRPQPVDLPSATASVAAMFRPVVEAGGLELRIDCPPAVSRVSVDADMWEQIVTNLVSNAFKHTFDGSIVVRLRMTIDGIRLDVTDTGTGIPAAELPSLFDRFKRVEGRRARSHEGSGVGLALVRELVNLHGGTVTVESEVDRGTRMTVELPLVTAGRAPAGPPASTPASPVTQQQVGEAEAWVLGPRGSASEVRGGAARVLVADDNRDMRAYLVRVLSQRFTVEAVPSGAAALEALDARLPDLVLADVMMPELDGFELVRRIRARPELEDLPVVLLSARAGLEAAAEGLQLGADDYLVKPFSTPELLARVEARLAAGYERRQRHVMAALLPRLAAATDVHAVAEAARDAAQSMLGATRVFVGTLDDRHPIVHLWQSPPLPAEIAPRYHTLGLDSPAPLVAALRDGIVQSYDGRGPVPLGAGATADAVASAGIAAWYAAPLTLEPDETKAAMALTWTEAHDLAESDEDFLREIQIAASRAIQRIRRQQREHALFDELQHRLLEVDLTAPSAAVGYRYAPAHGGLRIGGDWYDVWALPEDRLGFAVGDVVGNGLRATAAMGQLRGALAALSGGAIPRDTLQHLDHYAEHIDGAECTTAILAVLDPSTAVLEWCRAGHPPPLVADRSGARFLWGGLRPPLATRTQTDGADRAFVHLEPGSVVVLYTDGLVERRGELIDRGLDRLLAAVDRSHHLPVTELCEVLLADLAPPTGFRDDVAVLAFRTLGSTRTDFVDAFRATGAQVTAARRRLQRWLEDLGLEQELVSDLLVAVSEAATNAVEYGAASDPERVVTLEAHRADGEITVAINDNGRWSTDSSASALAGRGRGFLLMHRLMDDVRVLRANAGTTVLLTRRLAPEVAASDAG